MNVTLPLKIPAGSGHSAAEHDGCNYTLPSVFDKVICISTWLRNNTEEILCISHWLFYCGHTYYDLHNMKLFHNIIQAVYSRLQDGGSGAKSATLFGCVHVVVITPISSKPGSQV